MRWLMPVLVVFDLLVSVSAAQPAGQPATPFQLVEGDRVVFLGNTLIEREQRYGYWETALLSRLGARNVICRNLGWSGDTVWGEARAGFGSAEDGFRRLREEVQAVKPTVIFVGYGGNEAFAGEAGLARFRQGFDRLLDALAPTRAQIVLLSPIRQEDLGRPLPDPAEHNRNLRLYSDVLRQTAAKRRCRFVDLFDLIEDGARATPRETITDNGIHLTAYGYWRTATAFEHGLGLAPGQWRVEIDPSGKAARTVGTKVASLLSGPLRFQATDAELPPCPPPADRALPRLAQPWHPSTERVLRVFGLAPGKYLLKIDGKQVATATAADWAAGVQLRHGPEFDQSERLRAAIVAKNRLYFHRWRPENETYLFGFRKHEQGQNAREVPQFDPLVKKADEEIARLRVPVTHRYELLPTGGADR